LKPSGQLLFHLSMNTPFRLACCALSLISAISTLPPARAATTTELLVYFGTYPGPKSRGIYVSRLDLGTGHLSAPELAGELASPSFVALHPQGRFLYSVSEVGNFNGAKSGAVAAFAIDPSSGKLTLINEQPSRGEGPCHLSVDPLGKAVLVANYTGGSCAALPIRPDGGLQPATAFIQHHGSSVNQQRQQGPHAHGIYLDRNDRFAFVPDLGLDQIMIYKFDPAEGSLLPNDPPFAAVSPGSGPRHFAFHPSSKFAYVINEMLCTVTAFAYDSERGRLATLQTISTLPAGEALSPRYSTAELEMHPTGKFLYGSNRGYNTIVVFAVDPASGQLTAVQQVPTQGKTPRGFGIDPTGHFLIAGNQDSDTALVFRIDPVTGQLSPTGQTLELGAPVCVRFLPVKPPKP
jgi:6-phosphogluconolactonase